MLLPWQPVHVKEKKIRNIIKENFFMNLIFFSKNSLKFFNKFNKFISAYFILK